MRVLMFCSQFRPIVGGAERQAERQALALAEKGCRVSVLTPQLDPAWPLRDSFGPVAIERFPLSDLSRSLPQRGIGVMNAPWLMIQVAHAVAKRARHVDVVHCHVGSLQAIAAGGAARCLGVPALCKAAVADEKGDLGEMVSQGPINRIAAYFARRLFTRWIATTEAVRDALIAGGVPSGKIVCIPNGIELAPVGTSSRLRKVRRFLYLGRVSRNAARDVPSVVRAFERVAAENDDVELAIVGDGDQLDDLRSLVRSSIAADRIVLPGMAEANQWLEWADCFVQPSRREGLSNALIEAMSVGLPCIANDIPPNREVLDGGRAGLLVPVGDVPLLYAAMRSLIDDGERATALGRAARARVEDRYAIDGVATSLLGLYRQVSSARVANGRR